MGDYGYKFLEDLFERLKKQSIKDFDVVISDQSNNEEVYKSCKKYADELKIKYIRNFYGRGKAAVNANVAIESASGEIIKLIYQDDFFITDSALEKILKCYETTNAGWVINSFNHSHDRINFSGETSVYYTNQIILGKNTIGNPSNYSVLNKNKQYMDENLLYIVDCEMYFKTFLSCGEPGIVNEPIVCAMHHELSVEEKPEFRNLLTSEVQYCINKFNLKVV